jgi:hypothetical protein
MAAPEIPVKSPLALTGVILSILRKRFHPSMQMPWVYLPGEASRLENTISIEAASNPLPEERTKRPAVYVIRNPIGFQQAVIGDRNGLNFRSGATAYYATAEVTFTFIVESNEEGEAAQIADTILCTFMMGSDIIERVFDFRKLGPFSMSAVGKNVQDKPFAQIHISMGLSYDVRWGTIPIAPLLQEVAIEAQSQNYGSTDAYFTEIYMSSLRYREAEG